MAVDWSKDVDQALVAAKEQGRAIREANAVVDRIDEKQSNPFWEGLQ